LICTNTLPIFSTWSITLSFSPILIPKILKYKNDYTICVTNLFCKIRKFLVSQYHGITEWSGLEGTSVSHLGQPPCRSRVTYSRLHRTTFRRLLNISREGDSTTSLGSLCQCSVTLRGKKFFLMFRWNFLCFSLCPLPLVLSLGTTEKSLAPSS